MHNPPYFLSSVAVSFFNPLWAKEGSENLLPLPLSSQQYFLTVDAPLCYRSREMKEFRGFTHMDSRRLILNYVSLGRKEQISFYGVLYNAE